VHARQTLQEAISGAVHGSRLRDPQRRLEGLKWALVPCSGATRRRVGARARQPLQEALCGDSCAPVAPRGLQRRFEGLKRAPAPCHHPAGLWARPRLYRTGPKLVPPEVAAWFKTFHGLSLEVPEMLAVRIT